LIFIYLLSPLRSTECERCQGDNAKIEKLKTQIEDQKTQTLCVKVKDREKKLKYRAKIPVFPSICGKKPIFLRPEWNFQLSLHLKFIHCHRIVTLGQKVPGKTAMTEKNSKTKKPKNQKPKTDNWKTKI
jgi:hypothetical protein